MAATMRADGVQPMPSQPYYTMNSAQVGRYLIIASPIVKEHYVNADAHYSADTLLCVVYKTGSQFF